MTWMFRSWLRLSGELLGVTLQPRVHGPQVPAGVGAVEDAGIPPGQILDHRAMGHHQQEIESMT